MAQAHQMITQIADYFDKGCGRCARFDTGDCAALIWADGLAALRAVCLESGLREDVKWGHPCYMHAGRNIAVIGAFRGDFRLSFFNAALMKDPDGLLETRGPNTKIVHAVEMPPEFIEALDADPELAEAFHALTPGRQKSYAINLNGAKKPETRIARIAKFRDKIIAGKGALDR